ncbi:hypothetical protein ACFSW8_09575 [Rubritalea tangerina]|uniref:Uncharacterized protein n=2 Tax=Rubritalea tangerina TaxID=430798 RepID=A0ABW4ZBP1_9BACT
MAAHTVLSWVPRNLQEVDGMHSSDEQPVADLHARLKEAVEKSYEVTITEEELNRYLASKLQLTQSPIVDDYVHIKGIYVDLKPGVIDVSIEREFTMPDNQQADGAKKVGFLPMAQTVSMQLEVETVDDVDGGKKTTVHFPGGNFGKAPAPGLLVYVVKPSFDIILNHFSEEVELGYRQMTSVKVEDGLIKLDPRPVTAQPAQP